MSEDWQKLDPEKAIRILSEINPKLEPVPFAPGSTTLRTQKLGFYGSYELIELTDLSTIPPARKFAVYKSGDVQVVDWTNQAIYDTNEKAPLTLNERNVVSYVKFFFSYVRGRHGRFLIIENIDDIRWQIEPPLQGRKVMQDMLEPVTLLSAEEDGSFKLSAFMVFKDSLFRTEIHVKKNGLISMSNEELKIEGMPVLQDAAA
jgi:hypothetical protein